MTQESTPRGHEDSLSLLVFRIMEERLQATVIREEETDYQGVRDSRRTQIIGRVALVLVATLTPPVFYLIWTLVGSMGVITDRMESMKTQVSSMRTDFDEVSARMASMEGSVSRMSENIAVIPPMEERVKGMRDDFGVMRGAMGGIRPNVTEIDRTLGVMEQDMAQMSHVFGFLNRDVFMMRHNVNRMSSPMRMFPFFGQ
ncbi:hypothetical protein [Imhoffiella purpurea]|uniref:Uncharacterized protein n=1 Tax=Imhoffiella purpurea TaxID=1249627 RepID=W9W053_9GAMM|nr:hypothetical protein [Imhoffiella purpurea]EXJ16015.1 hypothetical protein D779_0639 [Imhoffiella purpurea]